MARPQVVEDLDTIELRGPELVTINMDNVGNAHTDPDMLAAIASVIKAGNAIPGAVGRRENYNAITFFRVLTETEESNILKRKQDDWDRAKEKYDAIVADPDHAEPQYSYVIKSWCDREGLAWPWLAAAYDPDTGELLPCKWESDPYA